MISLTKLPPPIPARSPRKSSGSAHMMLNPSSIGGEFRYRSSAGVLVYRKHMEEQAHLLAEKRFVSCKALVIEKKNYRTCFRRMVRYFSAMLAT